MNLTIIGTGYVGLVTGTCFSEMGHKVYCVDIDKEKINNLKKNILPIYEPNLKDLVISNQEKGNLIFTTDLKESLTDSDIVFITVGTPMNEDGTANLEYINKTVENIALHIDHHMYIVVKSTVPVGTCNKIEEKMKKILTDRESNITFDIISNPEFLKEGKAVSDCMKPDRIIIGANNNESFEIMKELYASFVLNHERFILMDIPSAELTKYASNAMLATRISFMNELSAICEKTGANIKDIRQGIGSDKRIGYDFLYAGCGYGGSCFPKDIQALIKTAEENNIEPKLLKDVEEINNKQKTVLVDKIYSKFGKNLKGLNFALWGLAFKPETNDIREAPSLIIIEELIKNGAKIQGYDPKANKETQDYFKDNEEILKNITFYNNRYDALNNADALILVTEWKEFRNINYDHARDLMKKPIIFDGRNIFSKSITKRENFELYQIGC